MVESLLHRDLWPVAATMALVLLLLYHRPAPDNTFIDSGKGAVEWDTGTQHKRVRGMVHGKNPDGICRLLWENWAATLTLCCLFCPTGKTTFLDTSNDHYITDLLLWNVS